MENKEREGNSSRGVFVVLGYNQPASGGVEVNTPSSALGEYHRKWMCR